MANEQNTLNAPLLHRLTGSALLALILFTGFLYWPGANGPFLLDDFHNLAKSQISSFNLDELTAATFANTSGMLKRPVAAFSFAITHGLYGADPWGYKWHNILLHLCCGVMIFLLTRRIFSALNKNNQQQQLAGIIAAAFWLLHPLQISTVLYAVQRMTQLSSLFIVLSCYCYMSVRQNNALSTPQTLLRLFVFLPLLALTGLFSKENAALTPLFFLLLEALLFKFKRSNSVQSRWLLLFWLGFIALPLIGGGLYFLTHLNMLNFSGRHFSLEERIMSQTLILIDYWQMIILPNINAMTLFHDGVEIVREWDWRITVATIFHGSLITLAIIFRKKMILSLAIGWFYVSHLLESTVLPLELMFEHRNYLSVLSGGLLLAALIIQFQHKRLFLWLGAALIMLLASASYERIHHWSDRDSIYTHMLSNHPQSMRAHIAYANDLLERKRFYDASQVIIQAGKLDHGDAGPILHLLKLSCYGEIQFKPGFYQLLHQQLAANPYSAYSKKTLHDISRLYMDKKCDSITLEQFEAIINAASTNPVAKNARGRQSFLLTLSARLISRDNINQAHALYQQAYQQRPSIGLLDEHAAILIQHNKKDWAQQVVAQMIEDYEPMTATQRRDHKHILQWHQQQFKGDTP